MFTHSDDELLRLWYQAYEPAVAVDVTPDELIVRSTRRGRYTVRCKRTTDLQRDLDAALAELVEQIS
ncbi:MAG TPA: hypothetical protein VHQ23_03865 [Ilumatobacteraceae bacterium]|nr:hypothetical protein [Ilumatobacteraceae bacterium]